MIATSERTPRLRGELRALLASARDAERVGHRTRAREHYERLLREVADSHRIAHGPMRPSPMRSHATEPGRADPRPDGAAAAEASFIAALLFWIGRTWIDDGELEVAGDCLQAALATAEAAGDVATAAHAVDLLAIVERRRTRPDLAELYHRPRHSARRWATDPRGMGEIAGDVSMRIMAEVNCAALWVARRDFTRARSACDTALRLIAESGDTRALGEATRHCGVIAREERRFEEAGDHLRRAWTIAVETEDRLLAAETAREQAELSWRMRCNPETVGWLMRAHRLFSGILAERDLADITDRFERLEILFLSMVKEWAMSIESKDRHARGHCDRVAEYACTLAAAFGFDERRLFWFRLGALLHDVGKLVVPSEILNTPGRITDEERAIVEHHPIAGVELLSGTGLPEDVMAMVRSHHERWDGQGYADGLRGERIPLVARILCVADVYDALTSHRAYRRAYDRTAALGIMSRDVGRMFDPRVFAMFASLGASIGDGGSRAARRQVTERPSTRPLISPNRPGYLSGSWPLPPH